MDSPDYTLCIFIIFYICVAVLSSELYAAKFNERERTRRAVKYLSAVISAVFILLATSIVSEIILMLILPERVRDIYVTIGLLEANIPSLLAIFIGAVAATLSFKASFKAKTGRLYIKRKDEM